MTRLDTVRRRLANIDRQLRDARGPRLDSLLIERARFASLLEVLEGSRRLIGMVSVISAAAMGRFAGEDRVEARRVPRTADGEVVH